VQLLLASLLSLLALAQGVAMTDLTAPQGELPAGCQLAPAPTVRLDGKTFQGGLWGNLPIDRNPWNGTDRPVLATIRERTAPPAAFPDAPPLTGSQLTKFRTTFAAGVEQGYAAFYLQGDAAVIAVYALTFADSAANPGRPPRGTVRVDFGSTSAYVSGTDGPCFHAVVAHLQALSR
jgi:hypothetical protein